MNQPAFRIALRVEGEMWNAYLAKYESMDGAILLGSIRLASTTGPGRRDYEVKKAFMDLMKMVFESALEQVSDVRVSKYDIERAPEHEKARSG